MGGVLALIPARGGSERVPGKNVRPLAGIPLLAHTIAAARGAASIDRVVVSTDSTAIAATAREAGAEVPFLRPSAISGADSTEYEFLDHAIEALREADGFEPELIVVLYPTSPFRRAASIDAAVATLREHPEADSLRSVRRVSEHPFKMWIEEGQHIRPFATDGRKDAHTLSYHLLPETFVQNASIYIVRTSTVVEKGSATGDVIVPFIMDETESLDVNTELDLEFANFLFERGIATPAGVREEPPLLIDEDLESLASHLTAHNDCFVCGGSDREVWASYGSYTAWRCVSCGFVWIDPMLDDAGLATYYDDYIGMREKDEHKTTKRAAQYEIDRSFVEGFVSGGRVLDIGCSGGFFLATLNEGFSKHGVEIDAKAVEHARACYPFGCNVQHGNFLDLYPADSPAFDLIVMRGVIEHLPNAPHVLERAASLLTPGGHLYFAATPNVESFSADLYRERWNQFHPVRHILYFSPRTLAALCERFGLRLKASLFPYLETPYADPASDHEQLLRDLSLIRSGHHDRVGRSPAFWGNMMNLVFVKED